MRNWGLLACLVLAGCGLTKHRFEMNGLGEGVTLDAAQKSGAVTSCRPSEAISIGHLESPAVPGKVHCTLSSRTFAGVAVGSSYVTFDNGVFDAIVVSISSSDFDPALRNLRSAYGEPCRQETVQTEVTRRWSETETEGPNRGYENPMSQSSNEVGEMPIWCFRGGDLRGRRITTAYGESSFVFPLRMSDKSKATPSDI